MARDEVAITGMGIISSIGNNLEEFYRSLLVGRCGIENFTKENFTLHRFDDKSITLAGRIKNFFPKDYYNKEEIARFDKHVLMILKAVDEALNGNGASNSSCDENIKVIIGSAVGLRSVYDRLNQNFRFYSSGDVKRAPQHQYYPSVVMEFLMETVLNAVFEKFKIQGEGLCLSTLCASGATPVYLGMEYIRNGSFDKIICIGFDTFHPRQNTVFSHYKMLSNEKAIPFDQDSKGFQLAEGVGVVVLEGKTSALKKKKTIYGIIKGSATTNDAYHIVIPSNTGKEYAKAIEMAVGDADIELADIDYISLIGRGSKASDKKELEGIRQVFRDLAEQIPINSITSYTGYSLGASSAISIIVTLLQMRNGVVLPILNFKSPHPKYKLFNYVTKKIEKKINTALICSHAFTGVNTAIVIKKYD